MKKGVSVIIENEKGEFLLMLRDKTPGIPFPGQWYFPSGVCEKEETSNEAAMRELKEEMGLDLRPIFFKKYYLTPSAELLEPWELRVFYARTNKLIREMELSEGAAIEFKDTEEILKLNLAANHNQVFRDFLEQRRKL